MGCANSPDTTLRSLDRAGPAHLTHQACQPTGPSSTTVAACLRLAPPPLVGLPILRAPPPTAAHRVRPPPRLAGRSFARAAVARRPPFTAFQPVDPCALLLCHPSPHSPLSERRCSGRARARPWRRPGEALSCTPGHTARISCDHARSCAPSL